MSVALVVFTDGRKSCIARTIPSALANLRGLDGPRFIWDDSADYAYTIWLERQFPDFKVIGTTERQGFGGAIANGWDFLNVALPFDVGWIFHLEDDYTFNRPVDLKAMQEVLRRVPWLQQMALRRQPWNATEIAAGGVVEQRAAEFTECMDFFGNAWLEHRCWFTTNPCLYRRSLIKRGWPDVEHSEGVFTHQLLEDPAVRFGYWGAQDSGEWVTHIGHRRAGVGY